MSNGGITSLVASYVKLRNIQALLGLRAHRKALISQQSQMSGYDLSLLKSTFENDLTAIALGLQELLCNEPVRGALDSCQPERIAGWAQYTRHPEVPVTIRIMLNHKQIGEVIADQFRPDLRNGQLGSGNHGYEFRPENAAFQEGDIVQVMSSTGVAIASKEITTTN